MASDRISATESQLSGRLIETPFEIAAQIVDAIGPRLPGSMNEAKTAALLDARLRQAGLRLSAESYRAFHPPGYDGIVCGILAVLGMISFYWMPLVALLIFVIVFGLALLALLYATPLLAPSVFSQNVVATRAAAGAMRRRLVFLAPLCSLPATGRAYASFGVGLPGLVGRAVAATVLLVFGVIAITPLPIEIRLWLWYAQAAPAVALVAQGIAAIIVQHASATPGAINYAGSLATLIVSAAHLHNLQHTELWIVGVGAGTGTSGIDDLFRRYPFEGDQTLFVGLDGVGSGTLCYFAAEGALRPRLADSLLLRLAARVVDGQQATAKPCVYRGLTLAGRLRRRGWRAMGIAALDRHNWVSCQYEQNDDLSRLDAAHLDNAVRMIVGLARELDMTQ